MTIIKAAAVPRLSRGGGVETIPLITRRSAEEENRITTGISTYPVGTGAPLHLHNCDEHVTLLDGVGEVTFFFKAAQHSAYSRILERAVELFSHLFGGHCAQPPNDGEDVPLQLSQLRRIVSGLSVTCHSVTECNMKGR